LGGEEKITARRQRPGLNLATDPRGNYNGKPPENARGNNSKRRPAFLSKRQDDVLGGKRGGSGASKKTEKGGGLGSWTDRVNFFHSGGGEEDLETTERVGTFVAA